MPEGTAAATTPTAPAAAPAAESKSPAVAKPTAQSKQPEAAPSWTDDDDAKFIDYAKRAPWLKTKVKGKESGVSSKEDVLALIADAQRGRGANQLVEATKKERAEAERLKAEAEQLRSLHEAARRGDKRARQALGLIPDEEAEAQRQAFEALDPETRAIFEENQKLREHLTKTERAEKQKLEAEKKAQREKRSAEMLTTARDIAKDLLADVRDEMRDVEVPEILAAMRAFTEAGGKYGTDFDASHVKAYVERHRGETLDGRLGRLKPDAAVRRVSSALVELAKTPEALEAALGENFPAVAKAIAARQLALYRQKKQSPQQSSGESQPQRAPKPPPQPLSPFRFKR